MNRGIVWQKEEYLGSNKNRGIIMKKGGIANEGSNIKYLTHNSHQMTLILVV